MRRNSPIFTRELAAPEIYGVLRRAGRVEKGQPRAQFLSRNGRAKFHFPWILVAYGALEKRFVAAQVA